jgi:serine/threonine protein kinase
MKVFCPGSADDAEVSHGLRETRVASQLEHPNIVKIRDIGICGEYRYIVSELIEGLSLDAWLRRFSCDPRQAAQWCETMARALHYAHGEGVVHRDLKPANIMIDEAGDPHIMDFGLAKHEGDEITSDIERYQLAAYRLRQDENSRDTSGPLLGTPAYMSPEQAQGDSYFVDHRTDIYSLGVIFYELLVARRPFGGHPSRLLRSIRWREPTPLRWLNRRVPRCLEAICLKAMAKRVDARFASAHDFADECERFVQGRPTVTQPTSAWRLITRWLWSRVTMPLK